MFEDRNLGAAIYGAMFLKYGFKGLLITFVVGVVLACLFVVGLFALIPMMNIPQ